MWVTPSCCTVSLDSWNLSHSTPFCCTVWLASWKLSQSGVFKQLRFPNNTLIFSLNIALSDITNKKVKRDNKKKLSDVSVALCPYAVYRKQIDFQFRSGAEKMTFTANLKRARTPSGCQSHKASMQLVLWKYLAKSGRTWNSEYRTNTVTGNDGV